MAESLFEYSGTNYPTTRLSKPENLLPQQSCRKISNHCFDIPNIVFLSHCFNVSFIVNFVYARLSLYEWKKRQRVSSYSDISHHGCIIMLIKKKRQGSVVNVLCQILVRRILRTWLILQYDVVTYLPHGAESFMRS